MCRLRQNLAAEAEAFRELTGACQQKDEKIVELEARVDDVTAAADVTRGRLAEREAAVEEARAEVLALEAELATCQAELRRTDDKLRETRQSLEDCLVKLETSEETLEAAREEVREMASAEESLVREKAELQKRIEGDRKLWEARERELVEGLRGAEQKARETGEEKESLRQQVEDLVSMEETLKAALERKRKDEAKVGGVRERVKELETEVKKTTEMAREVESENRALKQGEGGGQPCFASGRLFEVSDSHRTSLILPIRASTYQPTERSADEFPRLSRGLNEGYPFGRSCRLGGKLFVCKRLCDEVSTPFPV